MNRTMEADTPKGQPRENETSNIMDEIPPWVRFGGQDLGVSFFLMDDMATPQKAGTSMLNSLLRSCSKRPSLDVSSKLGSPFNGDIDPEDKFIDSFQTFHSEKSVLGLNSTETADCGVSINISSCIPKSAQKVMSETQSINVSIKTNGNDTKEDVRLGAQLSSDDVLIPADIPNEDVNFAGQFRATAAVANASIPDSNMSLGAQLNSTTVLTKGHVTYEGAQLNSTAVVSNANLTSVDAKIVLPLNSTASLTSDHISNGEVNVDVPLNSTADLTSDRISNGEVNVAVPLNSTADLTNDRISNGEVNVDVPLNSTADLTSDRISNGEVNVDVPLNSTADLTTDRVSNVDINVSDPLNLTADLTSDRIASVDVDVGAPLNSTAVIANEKNPNTDALLNSSRIIPERRSAEAKGRSSLSNIRGPRIDALETISEIPIIAGSHSTLQQSMRSISSSLVSLEDTFESKSSFSATSTPMVKQNIFRFGAVRKPSYNALKKLSVNTTENSRDDTANSGTSKDCSSVQASEESMKDVTRDCGTPQTGTSGAPQSVPAKNEQNIKSTFIKTSILKANTTTTIATIPNTCNVTSDSRVPRSRLNKPKTHLPAFSASLRRTNAPVPAAANSNSKTAAVSYSTEVGSSLARSVRTRCLKRPMADNKAVPTEKRSIVPSVSLVNKPTSAGRSTVGTEKITRLSALRSTVSPLGPRNGLPNGPKQGCLNCARLLHENKRLRERIEKLVRDKSN
ncbi:uncharacterized protein LOC114768397 [Denticeps clupeoides]|uniref:uncharacterized protein LOC114768397 n=1 Tax=Denticeps clupeoides TaxID=299321 RepID=UPI0010A522F5|nr:uncharacterized protein LOC114768397 [Denticeps clupeoides]